MRNFVVAVLTAAAGFSAGCGGTTPIGFCDNFEVEVCARVFECFDAATQASADFQSHYGTSIAECDTRLKTNNCASVTNDKPCATAAVSYHADKADACVADLKAAPCSAVVNNTFASDNCVAVCS